MGGSGEVLGETGSDDQKTKQTTHPGTNRAKTAHKATTHLALHGLNALVVILVFKLQEQVEGLAVPGLVKETSCVYLPFDGGVPVILHSIVRPVGRNAGPLTHSSRLLPRGFSGPSAAHPHIGKSRFAERHPSALQ